MGFAGVLVGEVLDVVNNGMDIAILDLSATCHMPDVLEVAKRVSRNSSESEMRAKNASRASGDGPR